MLNECHCHIIPRMDDGAKTVEESLRMIQLMRKQGVERIVATPHFYAHREKSVNSFLEKRQMAFNKLLEADSKNADILLGAEVSIEQEISSMTDIDKLCFQSTDFILLEMPYSSFSSWILDEIDDIAFGLKRTPILAHIHRYLNYYSKAEIEEILKLKTILQINNEAFLNFKTRKFVKSLIKEGYPYVFGSDSHNMTDRKPNWDLLKMKVNEQIINGAENLF